MQIPKTPRKPKPITKKCAVPECGLIFEGGYSSKYCPNHRDPQTREKKKIITEHVTVKNQVLDHEYTNVKTIIENCALDGCKNQFEVKIFPKQYVYPKYCPEHRNEHKRKSHLSQIAGKDIIL